MSERSYINSDGNVVFTSFHLRAKNSCCQSNCLHCPYGTTLKKIGVKILDKSEFDPDEITQLESELFPSDNYSSSLLAEAFGNSEKFDAKDLKVLSLKETICGLCYIKNNKIQKIGLKKYFGDQGITEDYLQSLLITPTTFSK